MTFEPNALEVKLRDLIVQATKERKHFYVKSVCELALETIASQAKEIAELKEQLKVRLDEWNRWTEYAKNWTSIDGQLQTIAQLRAELETARRVREKLTEQRNVAPSMHWDVIGYEQLKVWDAEIARVLRGDK